VTDRALLVVIDMQRLFGDPASPWYTPGYPGIVDHVESLVRSFEGQVVFTRFVIPKDPRGSWVPYYEQWDEVTRPENRSWMDLTEPWALRHPPTLDRTTFSKWGAELRRASKPFRTLVLCGVSTDCCVIATALPASDDGMLVRVVGDACAGLDQAAHERALAICAGFAPQITISTTQEELTRRRHPARAAQH
jgi:nicotinamidase-related amidase